MPPRPTRPHVPPRAIARSAAPAPVKQEETEKKAWSKYQKAIFTALIKTLMHLVIIARAGSGKTTTIVAIAKMLPPNVKALFVAFGREIKKELQVRLPPNVKASTTHSVGLSQIVKRFGRVAIDQDKGKNIASEVADEFVRERSLSSDVQEAITGRNVYRLASLAKNCMIKTHSELMNLAVEFDLLSSVDPQIRDEVVNHIAHLAYIAMERAASMRRVIDYDDMLFFPWKFNMTGSNYDYIIVDEAQDLNPAQLWLVRNLLNKTGRMIIVGDDRQAIYGWRGAQDDALHFMAKELNASVLPLSVTYRCPKSVVRMAQKYVPDLEYAENAIEGEIRKGANALEAKPGSFIISRKNAPLMKACLALIAREIPAVVMGKDVGATLISLIEKSRKKTVVDFLVWLENYKTREYQTILQAYDEDKAMRLLEAVTDKVMCLQTLCDGEETTADVIARIKRVFTDDDLQNKVVCGTVHKLKGLERDDVWVICETFTPDFNKEEGNLWYVAITRTKNKLHLIGEPSEGKSFNKTVVPQQKVMPKVVTKRRGAKNVGSA